jgi:hypothetical protein
VPPEDDPDDRGVPDDEEVVLLQPVATEATKARPRKGFTRRDAIHLAGRRKS